MQHVRFGPTGLHVSRLCLGTMTFGLQCDEKTSFAILDAAAEQGITFLDTADVYPLGGKVEDTGKTEQIVGKWLKGKREKFILATKCSGKMGNAPWQQGTSRKHVMSAIDASLKRLGTDYVDLYQVHHFDPVTPVDETVEAFDAVVKSGKARYVGVSNYHAYRVARALGRSEALGLAKLLRLLREARLASSGDWIGNPEAAVLRLAHAVGREFRLEVAPRSRLHFEAWTEDGALAVADVSEVESDEGSFFVRRLGPHAPVRVERARVVRRQTTLERWLEVRSVARKPV